MPFIVALGYDVFNPQSVGLFDNKERKEERIALSDLTDRFALAPRLHATVARYENKVAASA
jgi:hypothetical protein